MSASVVAATGVTRPGLSTPASRHAHSQARPLLLPFSRPFLSRHSPRRSTLQVNARQDLQQASKQKLSKAAGAVKDSSVVQRLVDAHKTITSNAPWGKILGISLLTSITFGSFVQTSHNNVYLPVYDVWPFNIGPAIESGLVPLLLAPIWVLYAYAQPLLDEVFADDPATDKAIARASSLAFNLLNWGIIVPTFLFSGWLYLNHVPSWQASAIMFATAVINWRFLDGTRQGLILAGLLAVGAPAAELVIVNVFHLWHYDFADFYGIVHWTAWCYAQYAHGTGNYGRYLYQKFQDK